MDDRENCVGIGLRGPPNGSGKTMSTTPCGSVLQKAVQYAIHSCEQELKMDENGVLQTTFGPMFFHRPPKRTLL